ncbi:MAG: hypothetical protein V2B13_03055 [Pseudomonadota bacterium]
MKKGKVSFQILLIGLISFLITGIPYFYGWIHSTPAHEFIGFVEGHEDTFQYFSFAKQAEEGNFFFEDRYTTTPHSPRLINWVWWGLGKLMAWTGWKMAFAYQFFRFLTTFVFTVTLYIFLGRYLEGSTRLWGVILILGGGGFGGILRVFQKLFPMIPIHFDLPDVWLVESHAFYSLMVWPHFTLAVTLILWIFMAFLRGLERHQGRDVFLAGILTFLLLFFHPFEFGLLFPVLSGVGFFWGLAQRKEVNWILGSLFGLFIFSLPGLVYYVNLSHQPVWKEVMGQMALITPDPFYLSLGFGLPFFLAVLTFRGLPPLAKVTPAELLLFSWFVGGFFLLFLPVNFRWHLINGWQIPLYLLAIRGLEERVIPYLQEKKARFWRRWDWRKLVYICLFMITMLTPLYLLQSKITKMRLHFGRPPYFLHQDEVEALKWLRTQTKPDEAVLCGAEIGQIIPAWTGNKVFLGHYCLTPDFLTKKKELRAFGDFEGVTWDRVGWLKSQKIRLVIQREADRLSGSDDLEKKLFLKKVFQKARIVIYQVNE